MKSKIFLSPCLRVSVTGIVSFIVSFCFNSYAQTPRPLPPVIQEFEQEGTGFHYAIENLNTGNAVQRGATGPNGITSGDLILAPNTTYRYWLMEDESTYIGHQEFTTPRSGQSFQIPAINLHQPKTPDSDNDGLHDSAEFILGTNAENSDTDDDGILDGAEFGQNINPLDGFVVSTGLIGSANTSGLAVDIDAFNDLAVVAESNRGITVFNVFNGMNPIRISQVTTNGTAERVSLSGNLVAIANGNRGLSVVDIIDPPSAKIEHQVQLSSPAKSVITAGTLAFVGLENGQLVEVDMVSGTILLSLNTQKDIHDLKIQKETLYVLQLDQVLAYAIDNDILEFIDNAPTSSSSVDGITRRKRLFVGGNYAYASTIFGYDVFDISDPDSIQRVGSAQNAGFGSFKQLIANGSGIGVAVLGTAATTNSPHHISVYDITDPSLTTNFQTTIPTPGLARAAAIFNGLAYVADSNAGMEVINYLPFDTNGTPPTISLQASFPLDPAEAEENKQIRVTANVVDDVQVRNVEFYIDNVKAGTDGNFPFEFRFQTPSLSEQSNFLLRVRASDTGGNATWTEELSITIIPDSTPPRVTQVIPPNDSVLRSVGAIAAFFNEAIDPGSITPNNFSLTDAGNDKILNTNDDIVPVNESLFYRDDAQGAYLTFPEDLESGLYQAKIGSSITDLAGNPLSSDTVWTFQIYSSNDPDADGDCVPDVLEIFLGTDPNEPADGDLDFDNDGLSNCGEIIVGSDPTDADTDDDEVSDGDEDTDMDGLSDGDEIRLGTDPFGFDTDDDGVADVDEVALGTDPTDPNSRSPKTRYSSSVSFQNAIPTEESSMKFLHSNIISFMNQFQSNEANATSSFSDIISFINRIPTEEANSKTLVSEIISFMNAIPEDSATEKRLYSDLISFLNSTLTEEQKSRLQFSLPVSFENQ